MVDFSTQLKIQRNRRTSKNLFNIRYACKLEQVISLVHYCLNFNEIHLNILSLSPSIRNIVLARVHKAIPRIIEINKLISNSVKQVLSCIWHRLTSTDLSFKEREMVLSALFVVIFINQILMKELLTRKSNNKKWKLVQDPVH